MSSHKEQSERHGDNQGSCRTHGTRELQKGSAKQYHNGGVKQEEWPSERAVSVEE